MTLLQEALAPRSDQLNADDLISGPRTLKITGARFVEGDRGGKRVIIHYEGENGRPFKPCKTMGRAMVMVWGIVDSEDPEKISAQFVGKSITVYRDAEVDFGAEKGIGGIRISHMSHITGPKSVKLTASQGKKRAHVFQPLVAEVRNLQADPARKWADAYIAAVNAAETTEALNAFTNEKAGKLAELESKRPELHLECLHALDNRRAALAFEPEGKPDDEFGEAFNDTGFEGEDA